MSVSTPAVPDELPVNDPTAGLPRMVVETHARLGPHATPQQVADDLTARGIDTSVDDVKQCWPEGGKLSG